MNISGELDIFLFSLLLVLLIFLSLVLASFFISFSFRYINDISYKDEPYSFCDSCHHKLSILDLIPLFSYIFLKGRCRYCKNKISPTLFIGELLSLLLFVTLYLYGYYIFNKSIYIIYYIDYIYIIDIFIVFLLIIGAYIDYKKYEIPYTLLILILVLVLIEFIIKMIINYKYTLIFNLGGLLLPLIIFILLIFIYKVLLKKDAIGMADVIMFTLLGLNVGVINIILLLFLASVSALIYYLFRYIKDRNKNIDSNIEEEEKISETEDNSKIVPFFPFIAIAYFIIFFIKDYVDYSVITLMDLEEYLGLLVS